MTEPSSSVQPSPVVLICDDDSDTRAILQLTLSAQGYRVIETGGAQEAMEQCGIALPDVIVMDILMPEVSGTDFVRWFRDQPWDSFVPVILLTALTDIESRVEGLQSGADDYITKPFHHRELTARVDAALRVKELTTRLQKQGRALEKANAELLVAQDALIQKERELAVVQLAGAAAHNLRQPVTSMLLTCHLLQQKLEQSGMNSTTFDEAKRLIGSLRTECEFMESIISRMAVAQASSTESYVGDLKIVSLDNPLTKQESNE